MSQSGSTQITAQRWQPVLRDKGKENEASHGFNGMLPSFSPDMVGSRKMDFNSIEMSAIRPPRQQVDYDDLAEQPSPFIDFNL